ncbi:hypothetical protein M405DRAFT_902842 [Rhizopogon salebrosus TDB-379]|nr:hypothetical protein M405DRAFT_902842 [Rhizopogon salebrosus TDB-379]
MIFCSLQMVTVTDSIDDYQFSLRSGGLQVDIKVRKCDQVLRRTGDRNLCALRWLKQTSSKTAVQTNSKSTGAVYLRPNQTNISPKQIVSTAPILGRKRLIPLLSMVLSTSALPPPYRDLRDPRHPIHCCCFVFPAFPTTLGLPGPETSTTTFVYESLVDQWYIADDGGRPVRQEVRHFGHMGEDIQDANWSIYVTPKGDINPQQLLIENVPLQPGTLVFRTTSARFDVTRAQDVAGADVVTNYAVYSILSDFLRPSTLVGRVILPYSTSTDSPTSYEFIVLARTGRCGRLYDENVLRKPYFGCMLYVMAVQKVQDDGMMVRVGVGVIVEQAWLDSTPEEKIVFLG